MERKQDAAEQRFNELLTLFKVAMEKQAAINEMTMRGMTAVTDKLEKLDARAMTSETAILVLKNQWPAVEEIIELMRKKNVA